MTIGALEQHGWPRGDVSRLSKQEASTLAATALPQHVLGCRYVSYGIAFTSYID